MEADTAQRYRSRILREMNANHANPFNSPPSSTGSRGTLSPTVSVFSDPDGKSTRRLHQDIAWVTAPRKLPVNWEAAHRKWPDFFLRPGSRDAADTDKQVKSHENKPPVPALAIADDSTHDVWQGSTKTRAEMQPRVDNDSDHSSKSPFPVKASRNHQSSHAKAMHSSQQPHRRPSISDALDRLRRASLSPPTDGERRRQSRESGSPPLSSAKSSLTAVPSPDSFVDHRDASPSHARSFAMPDVSHLGDFVTGTLKFSGSMKNGVPIFVKNGKVHDRRERPSAGAHAEVDGFQVPAIEDKIFVSMDMIRDEIISLQEHHDKVQEYAETLQQQVERLEAQIKSTKGSAGNAGGHQSSKKLAARKHRKRAHQLSKVLLVPQLTCRRIGNRSHNVAVALGTDAAKG